MNYFLLCIDNLHILLSLDIFVSETYTGKGESNSLIDQVDFKLCILKLVCISIFKLRHKGNLSTVRKSLKGLWI